ncbi:ABC transporter substrate-binding protein [Poseidonocella sedimentorum]|uniref:Probable sugar-binding periplasmic protein n=1 Tax=Poseidonocella sedimentorum TaxID=871652 RepID=A0A1I6CX17_9RHOB|nr:ABC transporter substrate-binding protein [Poseidonocella sedimentorum]SFQ97734.1 carbohydrate ABC transporter substrate-binding protein, CUT1 family [Poseidonocella sedimentorum]
MTRLRKLLATSTALVVGGMAHGAEIEVTHWWTSGGEAAAVAEFAKAFNEKTDHTWVDGAIAGGSGAANPVISNRILGGEPMGATMMNTGRDSEEMVDEGLMLDITDVVEASGILDVESAPGLFENCKFDGKYYCVVVNIHSWQWMWTSRKAFEDAGVEPPTNWDEFVAAAPALEAAGKIPLAMGQQSWQSSGAFGVLQVGLGGVDHWLSVYRDRDMAAIEGDEMRRIIEAFAEARTLAAGSTVQDWNQATNMVITDQAGAQIMGDWAQGEFSVAGEVAGQDYDCLPGLGFFDVLSTGGDSFYFPVNDDPEVTAAQKELAALLISPEVQVAFNLKKGSLPVRNDVDLEAANDCMKKGLEILKAGNIMPDGEQMNDPDTEGQLEDLWVEFWFDHSITAEDAHERFIDIMARAE